MKEAKGRPEMTLACIPGMARQFNYQTREERLYELPDNYPSVCATENRLGGAFARELLFSFQWRCVGFDVGQFNDGYDLKLIKEDENYAYITAQPRIQNESIWFSGPKEIKIALRKTNFQPRTIIVLQPNGNTATWDFLETSTNLNPPVSKEVIEANLPLGWKKVELPKPSAVKHSSSKVGNN